jgi:hypothetical protein
MTNDGQDLGEAGTFALSPEAATAKLAELTAAYKGTAPETPTNAGEAKARLQTLSHDAKWYQRFITGNPTARAEFTKLTEMVANSDESPSDYIETVDSVTDPHALPRTAYNGLIDALRDGGLPADAETYMRELDAGLREDRPTQGDGAACKQTIDRLLKDAGFRQKYLSGDIAAVNNINALNRIIAYAANDGQPLSDDVMKQLETIRARGS